MKRIISIFLAVLMLLTLVGCNSNNTGDTSDETNNVEVITPSTSNKDDELEVKCPICDFSNYHRHRMITKESDKEEKNKKGE